MVPSPSSSASVLLAVSVWSSSRCATNGHRAGRRVVDIRDRADARAGDTLIGAFVVGVAGHDGDRGTDVGLCERVRAGRGSTDVDAIALPLVTDGSQPVFVGQRVAGG